MNRKIIKTLLTADAENCKHERFTCADCSSTVYIFKEQSKSQQIRLKRRWKQLQEAYTEEEAAK